MAAREKRNIHVFVSFAASDQAQASDLIEKLKQNPNVKVCSTSRLRAGEQFKKEIPRALSESDYFFVLLSPTSVESALVQTELGAAWGLDKPIIPVVTTPDVIKRIPLDFRKSQIVDFEAFNEPETLNRVFKLWEKSAA